MSRAMPPAGEIQSTRRNGVSTIEKYANPVFGDIAAAEIATAHVLAALEPIWRTTPETASRLRGRIEAVLDFAKARGWRSGENPAAWKGHLALTLARTVPRSRRSSIMLRCPSAKLATSCRSSKPSGDRRSRAPVCDPDGGAQRRSRGATWSEIDFEIATWIISADRMKAGQEHRVPLSEPALEILRDMAKIRTINDPDALVFPGRDPGARSSDMSLTAVLRRMKRGDLTAHGFRSPFRDWAAEATSYPAEIVEMALAHAVGNKVEAAYRRGDLFEKRRRLMDDWGKYCAQPSISRGKIILQSETNR